MKTRTTLIGLIGLLLILLAPRAAAAQEVSSARLKLYESAVRQLFDEAHMFVPNAKIRGILRVAEAELSVGVPGTELGEYDVFDQTPSAKDWPRFVVVYPQSQDLELSPAWKKLLSRSEAGETDEDDAAILTLQGFSRRMRAYALAHEATHWYHKHSSQLSKLLGKISEQDVGTYQGKVESVAYQTAFPVLLNSCEYPESYSKAIDREVERICTERSQGTLVFSNNAAGTSWNLPLPSFSKERMDSMLEMMWPAVSDRERKYQEWLTAMEICFRMADRLAPTEKDARLAKASLYLHMRK